MPKQYANIARFKRIEAALRKVTVSCSEVTEEIDKAMKGKRTEKEKEALDKIRNECLVLKQKGRDLLHDLYGCVE